jgi:hypothetical protein
MSYKHIGTAADLVRFGCSLRIECTALKRAVSPGGLTSTGSTAQRGRRAANTMRATEVALKCGTGNLERIRTRLKCERCGKKAACLAVLPPV